MTMPPLPEIPEGDRFVDNLKFRFLGTGAGHRLYEAWDDAIYAYAAAVRAATIEECAKVCIEVGAEHPNHSTSTIRTVSKWCAAAIRALK